MKALKVRASAISDVSSNENSVPLAMTDEILIGANFSICK